MSRPGQPGGTLARAQERARAAHQRGLQAGSAFQPAVAARHVRAGLDALGWTEQASTPDANVLPGDHHALVARLLMSLAHYEAEQCNTGYGLRLLDHAEPLAAAADRGVLLSQRGLVCQRIGRNEAALKLFDEAVPLLRDYPDSSYLARTLLNRGVAYLSAGDIRRARADSTSCARICADQGFGLMAAKAMHNLGYCDLLSGDLPSALRLFNAAEDRYRTSVPGALAMVAMDKARALLAAGLADEAGRVLDGAIAAFRRQRLHQDQAEAELARAHAALVAGDLAAARHWATAAMRRFQRRGNNAGAWLAELSRLRARPLAPAGVAATGVAATGIASAGPASAGPASAGPASTGLASTRRAATRLGVVAADAIDLAGRLAGCGLRNDAAVARLIAARALIAAGRPAEAPAQIEAARRPASLDVAVLRKLARAELAAAHGRPGPALAELRAGLALVHARRGRVGSLDLQTGIAALGADLAATGLRVALDRGSAPLVFAWHERSRAQAFRIRPVRPPADPRVAELLAELRLVTGKIREAEISGRHDPPSLKTSLTASMARRVELQRQLTQRSWEAAGPGSEIGQPSLGEISAAVTASGQNLISILARNGQMAAVVVTGRSVRLVDLGDLETAAEAARKLSADLDTLAGHRLPARIEAVIRESIRRQTGVLTAELIAPLRRSLGDAGVILVPAAALAGVPWNLLPELRGRAITVCPSAASWLTAWRRGQANPAPVTVAPVLAAGPHLRHAEKEIAEIAALYPGCKTLYTGQATVEATLRALDGAQLAHLATHGHHDRENVLFSRLDLADGPLMAYDIQNLRAPPRQVIISACDAGRIIVRPGEEILGFTAALLYIGTTTVISSVTRVADSTAISIMTAYHQALRAGTRPAQALADAAMVAPVSPFVCFGAG